MNNSVTLIGRVGQTPKSTLFSSGKRIVEFSIGVKEWDAVRKQEFTIWFDVKCFGSMADRVLDTIAKGREVVVTGRLGIEAFTRVDGTEVIKPVVKLFGFYLCGKKTDVSRDAKSAEADVASQEVA